MSSLPEATASPKPTPKPAPNSPDLAKITPEVLVGLPEDQRQELLEMLVVAKSHQGPLPAPETLEHYGRIIPNAPAIMLNEVVKQSAHRQEMECILVRGNVRFATTGQWMAFVLVIFLASLSTYLAINGHPALSGTVFVTTIGAVLSAFLFGKSAKDDEPEPSPPSPPPSQQQIDAKGRKRR